MNNDYHSVDHDELAKTMGAQFRVWSGVDNAEEILRDTCRALGHHVLNLSGEGDALNEFDALCRFYGGLDP